ncbi:heme ABC exporter ATP-binding protein CcmA [Nisaea acidiphila]|uniref:Heme ABC exporter ATP-binding protein CcmA n=1 Tax=Nisaea acidiphila TaxID=1862145 RepID=A0A9J7AUN8_9PROT|nr:heme ABC exporter ATP-binding protein CcmA [Nisaea acidiphila]UUX51451.1 heme ABC exporter ATP-binding protein CcmA [Nisaea acidiphila]
MEYFGDHRFEGAGLRCRRGGRLVFDRLDFALGAGGVLILKGPNGSGKSSLLRVMASLVRAEAGGMTWDGATVADDPAAHAARLHYVGHADAAKPAMSAEELLTFWREMRGGTGIGVGAALERFGISHRADFPARYLSSGQKRRLALSRLLVSEAPLWILDEPTVGLDANGVAALEEVIAEHRARGGMVVAATHIRFETGDGVTELDLSAFAPGPAELDAADALLGAAV